MITVFTTWRSASSRYCSQLVKDNPQYVGQGEIFHEKYKNLNVRPTLNKLSTKQSIIKVMPYHIRVRDNPTLLKNILELTERPIFLIRKNLDEAIQSYYVAKYLQLTGKFRGDWHEEWDEPMHIEFDRNIYNKYISLYQQELYWLSDLYHDLDKKELVWSEDYMRSTTEKKYNRPVIWDRNPGYCNIDVEELF
jgi:hypothetical protein